MPAGLSIRLFIIFEMLLIELPRARTELKQMDSSSRDCHLMTLLSVATAIVCVLNAAVALFAAPNRPLYQFDPSQGVRGDESGKRSGESTSSIWDRLTIGWLTPLLSAGAEEALQDEV